MSGSYNHERAKANNPFATYGKTPSIEEQWEEYPPQFRRGIYDAYKNQVVIIFTKGGHIIITEAAYQAMGCPEFVKPVWLRGYAALRQVEANQPGYKVQIRPDSPQLYYVSAKPFTELKQLRPGNCGAWVYRAFVDEWGQLVADIKGQRPSVV